MRKQTYRWIKAKIYSARVGIDGGIGRLTSNEQQQTKEVLGQECVCVGAALTRVAVGHLLHHEPSACAVRQYISSAT